MSQYYNTETYEIQELDDVWYQSLIDNNNPKANGWKICPPVPSYDAKTQNPPVWNMGEWIITNLTSDEISTLNRITWTTQEFLAKFTQAELIGIITASRTDAVLELAKLTLAAATVVVNSDPQTVQYMEYLVHQNLLTSDRYTEILTTQ